MRGEGEEYSVGSGGSHRTMGYLRGTIDSMSGERYGLEIGNWES